MVEGNTHTHTHTKLFLKIKEWSTHLQPSHGGGALGLLLLPLDSTLNLTWSKTKQSKTLPHILKNDCPE